MQRGGSLGWGLGGERVVFGLVGVVVVGLREVVEGGLAGGEVVALWVLAVNVKGALLPVVVLPKGWKAKVCEADG